MDRGLQECNEREHKREKRKLV